MEILSGMVRSVFDDASGFWVHIAGRDQEPLLSEDGTKYLWDTPELDYLTHVVFRMYENKR